MSNHIIINGEILPQKKALVSVQDRGFRFGDGAFETCLIEDGKIYNWNAHFKRLTAGLKAIKITLPRHSGLDPESRKSKSNSDSKWIPDQVRNDNEWLKNLCHDLIKKNKIKNGILRIAISRGVGSIGYLPAKEIKPTIVIETLEKRPTPKSPIKLMVSSYVKPSLKSLPVNYKLANGLNSVLVKIEANEKNYFDAIILNEKKQICETSAANIFWIKNDVLYTPSLDSGCLAGTVREKILKLSPIKTKLVKAKLSDLLKADEVFVTNISLGVLAINQIQKTKFIGKKYSKIFADILMQDIKKQTT